MISDALHRWMGQFPITVGVVLGVSLALGVFVRWRHSPSAVSSSLPWRLGLGLLTLSVLTLAITGLPDSVRGSHLEHWTLMLHVAAAGPFVVLLVVLALDRVRIARRRRGAELPSAVAAFVVLSAGLVTAGSMLASMFPWFGTSDLERLLDLHRHAGLVVVAALIVLVSGSRRTRR